MTEPMRTRLIFWVLGVLFTASDWWIAQAATMTDSAFQGTILAGSAITITRGTFNGDALAQSAVTMTGTTLTGCEQTSKPAVN